MIKLTDLSNRPSRMDRDPRPYTRWWWFSNPITVEAIEQQIAWAASQGFGGVEIAWVYPQPDKGPGVPWLSPAWQDLVAQARRACDRHGLGCDLTFGTLWPFGGSFVEPAFASQTWEGPSAQRLGRSWELSHKKEHGRILNHLESDSFHRYARVMGAALQSALEGTHENSLFCDSWEVETVPPLWTAGFREAFQKRFGYDVLPLMPKLDSDPEARYDYRSLLAEYVYYEFYVPYSRHCHTLNASARVQCHGAPTDILAAYALVDVPESEALLFDPEFSSIAASAALLAGQKTVSCEAFTCLYGWIAWPGPAPHIGEERLDDLKLCADALFASGVNSIVWHGMPQDSGDGKARFYAGVHVGPQAAIAPRLKDFNGYMAQISAVLKRGVTYSRLACLLPYEDALMAGELPKDKVRPSGVYYWEFHHILRSEESRPYAPLWVSSSFLAQARWEKGFLVVGEGRFEALLVDCEYLEQETLAQIVELAEAGMPLVLKRLPREPGKVRHDSYQNLLLRLSSAPCVSGVPEALPKLKPVLTPLQPETQLPPFWVRKDGETYYVFLAHPLAAGITYPMPYAYAAKAGSLSLEVRVELGTYRGELTLEFPPSGSLLYSITGDKIVPMPIPFEFS